MINNIINFKMDNGINVKVDRNNQHISKYDLQDHIEGLFELNIECKEGQKIHLSDVCDSMFDLIFCGINKENKEMSFRLC